MAKHPYESPSPGAAVLRGLLSGLLSAAAGWIGYSALLIDHHLALPAALETERTQRKMFVSRTAGLLSYYADTTTLGRPLALLHSINAAGSSYEMRPLYHHFHLMRPTYALDLPGFGFSERSDRAYSPRLYTDAILDFLQTEVGEPADVVALSLTSEFAARAALENPDAFHTLTLISPTGFTARGQQPGPLRARQTGMSDFFYHLFSFPLWAQAFYDLLVTRLSIRYFLQQNFVGPYDPALAAYADATSHQPGARHAPLYFVSGKLFTPDIRQSVYEKLRLPSLVIFDRDPNVGFETLDATIRSHANWYGARIASTRGLPHFERMAETAAAMESFWTAQDPLKPFERDAMSGWSAEDTD